MFAKLFQKTSQSQSSPQARTSDSQVNATNQTMESSMLDPFVLMHYGIPSTASILSFDHVQRLLAVGTLDGRIKVIGGDNIEGLLISPKAVPFKNLEFLQNQGFLVTVSSENEVQVWDLEKRCISSSMQWESNITAFSVISGTSYMYFGDEYGFLSVMKYDAEEGKILQLPYHMPPNLITDGAGISLPDQPSIVGVLSQPSSGGNRVLVAYGNGLIVLWDITEDRAVHVRGFKDLKLNKRTVVKFSKSENESHTYQNDSLHDDEEGEKEISSLCWVSSDGSVLAVGYVDGDILLWNLSVSDGVKAQKSPKSPDDVVKLQLSSGDRRLPVIVLHWSSTRAQNGCSGQLFVYGGEDIGSEEVLTILDLDWSSGLAKLKCLDRVDLTLHGSFADLTITSNVREVDNSNFTSLFLLTNPGQLHFYEYATLSAFNSGKGKNHAVNALQYSPVIPTVEPCMTIGRLYTIGSEINFHSTLLKTTLPAKLQSDSLSGGSTKWPLTGGVPCQMSTSEREVIKQIYVGGYQDGSVRLWDATFPVLSLLSVLEFKKQGTEIPGASGSISALDFSSANLCLAIGNTSGVIFICCLGNCNQKTATILTETKQEVHDTPSEEKNQCSATYTVLDSPLSALKFTNSGVRLVAGFECGKVAVLDTRSQSVLFITDYVTTSKAPVISLSVGTASDVHEMKNSEGAVDSKQETEIAFILTKDAHMVLMNSTTGSMINSQPIHPKQESTAISMHLLGSSILTQNSNQNQSEATKVEAIEPTNSKDKLAYQILLCCGQAAYLYPLKSIMQGDDYSVHKLKIEKPISWTALFKRDSEECGIIILYQTGDVELRSFPDFKLLGSTSVMSTLRWNFKNIMDKTMSASDNGLISMVNRCEVAFVSLLPSENKTRNLEYVPCLHDKVLADATNSDENLSPNQKRTQKSIPGFVHNMIKGLKGVKGPHELNYTEAREMMMTHLETIFSRFPFSGPDNAYEDDDLELNIEDIDIDEPVIVLPSSQENTIDTRDQGTDRERLFEGSSTSTKPTVRTREEIIAKYRKTGDAASAASQAKDKLLERQEKLEKLSRRTEELQSGAEDFASMASELAKTMEKRKWWNF